MDMLLGAGDTDFGQCICVWYTRWRWILHLDAFARKKYPSRQIRKPTLSSVLFSFQTTTNMESNSSLIVPTIVVLTMLALQTMFEWLATWVLNYFLFLYILNFTSSCFSSQFGIVQITACDLKHITDTKLFTGNCDYFFAAGILAVEEQERTMLGNCNRTGDLSICDYWLFPCGMCRRTVPLESIFDLQICLARNRFAGV